MTTLAEYLQSHPSKVKDLKLYGDMELYRLMYDRKHNKIFIAKANSMKREEIK